MIYTEKQDTKPTMKRLPNNPNVIVGTARQIQRLYKKLEQKELAESPFLGEPIFNKLGLYGLELVYHDEYTNNYYDIPQMWIINSSTLLDIVLKVYD